MKKVIALILAALMVLGLAACAAKTTTTEQDTDTPAQTAPADKAAEETTAADAADKQITVGFCPMISPTTSLQTSLIPCEMRLTRRT